MWLTAKNISINLSNVIAIQKTAREDKFYITFYSTIGQLELDFGTEELRDNDYDILVKGLK